MLGDLVLRFRQLESGQAKGFGIPSPTGLSVRIRMSCAAAGTGQAKAKAKAKPRYTSNTVKQIREQREVMNKNLKELRKELRKEPHLAS